MFLLKRPFKVSAPQAGRGGLAWPLWSLCPLTFFISTKGKPHCGQQSVGMLTSEWSASELALAVEENIDELETAELSNFNIILCWFSTFRYTCWEVFQSSDLSHWCLA